mmetsp:Transcript_33627/g.46019  ORF Transcript_33627/g.46019 Transcript_33627/m.46019 type:complete len:96 (+) Transcript_33627:106-393(+)
MAHRFFNLNKKMVKKDKFKKRETSTQLIPLHCWKSIPKRNTLSSHSLFLSSFYSLSVSFFFFLSFFLLFSPLNFFNLLVTSSSYFFPLLLFSFSS